MVSKGASMILVNIDSYGGLLPGGINPPLKPVLTYYNFRRSLQMRFHDVLISQTMWAVSRATCLVK